MQKTTPLIKQLSSLKLLSGSGRVLDLGVGKGEDSTVLAEMGYDVEAVDRDPKLSEEDLKSPRIQVVKEDILNFQIEPNKYAIIIAKNVLPFLNTPEDVFTILSRMSDGAQSRGIIYFTLFGPRDGWRGSKNMSFIEYEDAVSFINSLPLEIQHMSTEEGYGLKMDGEIKYWHIHKFLCLKK